MTPILDQNNDDINLEQYLCLESKSNGFGEKPAVKPRFPWIVFPSFVLNDDGMVVAYGYFVFRGKNIKKALRVFKKENPRAYPTVKEMGYYWLVDNAEELKATIEYIRVVVDSLILGEEN
jgi:hypothetical protein